MHVDFIEWEDEGDPKSNIRHMAAHDVTPEEFVEILDATDRDDVEPSVSHPSNWTILGETDAGRTVRIVFEMDDSGGFVYIRPITGYEPTE
jgi:hypothetical protein